MINVRSNTLFAKILFVGSVLFTGNAYAAYPVAKITNYTNKTVSGTVKYASALCKNDSYSVAAGNKWSAKSRGGCLITGITVAGGSSYSSSGTSYSTFGVLPIEGGIRVHRVDSSGTPMDTGSGYPVVNIKNYTTRTVSGTVKYASAFCKNDNYSVTAGKTWTGRGRGICLVTAITIKGSKGYNGTEYSSSGTSYSTFGVIPVQDGMRVHRVDNHGVPMDTGSGYPLVQLTNRTLLPIKGKVEYLSAFCKDDNYMILGATVDKKQPDQIIPGTWRAPSRGVCLVGKITAEALGGKVPANLKTITAYTSTGTSYSKFRIQPYAGAHRVFSEEEFKTELARQSSTKSPGFKIHNKTNYPVNIGLEQLGCLYHGIVQPESTGGKPFVRNTGAVWFTISAKTVPFGADETSDWDCVEPVAELVIDIGIGVATGGAGGAALTAAKTAAKQGIKIGVKQAIKSGAKAGLKAGGKKIASNIGQRTAKELGKEAAKETGIALAKRGAMAATQSDGKMDFGENVFLLGTAATAPPGLNALAAQAYYEKQANIAWEKSQNIRETSDAGEYAGYEWPFRCDHMPEYEITGGPNKGDWSTGKPLKITKLNTCGNDLM